MTGSMTGPSRVAIYGRSYLDAEVEIALATLAEGKGKVDADVNAVLGGFGCNAARALATRLPPGAIRLVTVTSWLDWPRMRRVLPESIVLDAILTDSDGVPPWPAISVIVNPAGTCRLLRGRSDDDAAHWSIDRVTAGALAASVHVLGRVPPDFVADLVARRGTGARIAWCGGAALPRALEAAMDVICVNVAEAKQLLDSTSDTPESLARGLAARADSVGAVRLVTGRDRFPSVAAVRGSRGVTCHHGAPPRKLPAARIRRLKGVGDAFAARFIVEACLDARATPRRTLDVRRALSIAQRSATAFISKGRPRGRPGGRQ